MKKIAKKESKTNKYITIASIAILAEVFLFFIISKDSGSFDSLRWLIAIAGVAILLRPYLAVKELKFFDNGFCLSFCLGLGISFLLSFFVSAIGICEFNTFICFASVIILSALAYVLPKFVNINAYKWDKESICRFIWGFAIFALFFQFAFWVIGFRGDLDWTTENYMDYAFMQAIFRQKLAIPYDVWMAGEKLNYYFLGQEAAVFLCRLAFTTPEYGYNLMLCTFWAVNFVATGEIVYALVNAIGVNTRCHEGKVKIASLIAAATGAVYNAFAGNGHWLVYGVLGRVLNIGSSGPGNEFSYWFPSGTVYISTELGDLDNGKNEFPAYSAILGDLHAHVINVIFVVALLVLIFDYIFIKKEDEKKSYANLVLCGVLLGLYKGSNFWDFAIYYVIVGAIVVFGDFAKKGINIKSAAGVAIKALLVTAVSTVVILPFTLNFKKMASQICIAQCHSPIGKMIVLWAIPVVVTVAFIILINMKNNVLEITVPTKAALSAFCLCVLGLVLTPEVIYIKDIYGDENARFNTMFKLTYQAFILFGIIIAVTVGLLLINAFIKKREKTGGTIGLAVAGVLMAITILLATYTKDALSDWMGDVTEKLEREGISTIEPLYNQYDWYYQMQIYDALKNDDKKVLNIAEGSGDSYCHECSISTLTGACTPLGWYVHEWMWRDDGDYVAVKCAEVADFYQSGDSNMIDEFIKKYDIDYIVIGPEEQKRYFIDVPSLTEKGDTIWEAYDVNLGDMKLIKVKRNY